MHGVREDVGREPGQRRSEFSWAVVDSTGLEARCTDKVRWASKPGASENSTLGFQARRKQTSTPRSCLHQREDTSLGSMRVNSTKYAPRIFWLAASRNQVCNRCGPAGRSTSKTVAVSSGFSV